MVGLEGTLVAAVCLTAIAYAVRDLIHPDPVDDPNLIIIYSLASFVICRLRRLHEARGRRAASQLVLA